MLQTFAKKSWVSPLQSICNKSKALGMCLFHPVDGLCMHTEPVLSGHRHLSSRAHTLHSEAVWCRLQFLALLSLQSTLIQHVCSRCVWSLPDTCQFGQVYKLCQSPAWKIGVQAFSVQCVDSEAFYEFSAGVKERIKHKCLWLIQLTLESQGDDQLIKAGQGHTQEGHRDRVN